MNFRELSYVVAIAKHQSVGGAAKALGVSQPTLSKFIQHIENEIGQPLFKKLGNKFLLTPAGDIFERKAKVLLSIKHELDFELEDLLDETVGVLKIAFPIMRGTYMLPCTLPVFAKQFPKVQLLVQEANSARLEDMVLNGDIDIAFFTLPIRSTDITHSIINEEEIVLVMAANHPLAKQGISRSDCKYPWMDLAKLSDERFLVQRPDQRTRQITNRLFREAEIEPNIILEARNIHATVQLASEGYGVTFVGETHLKHVQNGKQLACFSIGNPCTTTSFVAAYRSGVHLPKYAKEYIRIVKEFT
jgi:Transcriptional regulator